MVEKILVNRFSPGKTFVDAVPELNARLAHFPAQINFAIAKQSGEVDQADVQVLNDAAGFLHTFESGFKTFGVAVVEQALSVNGFTIDQDSTHHDDSLGDRLKLALHLVHLGFERDGFQNGFFDFGQKALSLTQSEASRHE